jgi:hypothetical protein
MTRKIAIIFCILWTIFVIGGLAYLIPAMKPIKKGNIKDYCYVAFGVDSEGKRHRFDWGLGAVIYSSDEAVYLVPGYHGSELYRIQRTDIDSVFSKIIDHLERQLQENDPNNISAKGYLAFKNYDNIRGLGNIELLTDVIHSSYQEYYATRDEISRYDEIEYYNQEGIYEHEIKIAVDKAKYFWANCLFEFFYVSGLAWFLCWPLIKRMPLRNFIFRVSILPFMLLLPYYLGYNICPQRFFLEFKKSCVCLDGGILYMAQIPFLRGGYHSEFDRYLLERTPRILEPLNQGNGIPLANESLFDCYFNAWGPLELLAFCVVFYFTILILCQIIKRCKEKQPANNDRIAIAQKQ